jgi:hypothetical protein
MTFQAHVTQQHECTIGIVLLASLIVYGERSSSGAATIAITLNLYGWWARARVSICTCSAACACYISSSQPALAPLDSSTSAICGKLTPTGICNSRLRGADALDKGH